MTQFKYISWTVSPLHPQGPGTHTKTTVKRSSKTKRNELSRSPKHRPDPDEPSDSDQDSDGPGTHTKTTVKRSSKTKRNGSAMQKKTERRPWSDGEKKAVWRQLGNYITLAKVPGKEKCLECIEAESALEKSHWMDIKNQVHNTIQSRKKKMLS
ncbi:hypothetical protein IRJ41_017285 [Triplophysa rosa]|uniref:Uncharacterized protein n=1 Tax=Triplophysa rosa TaxID=992332 RepID=A0A9W7WP38_TRIRA|nr:hypothetical protein IRJ41_017285 [Triplophysa rosa]